MLEVCHGKLRISDDDAPHLADTNATQQTASWEPQKHLLNEFSREGVHDAFFLFCPPSSVSLRSHTNHNPACVCKNKKFKKKRVY